MTIDARHLVAELFGVEPSRLRDADALRTMLIEAAQAAGAHIVDGPRIHVFPGEGGVTAFVLLAESHIALHTWPERGSCALDAFTCGQTNCQAALDVIRQMLQPTAAAVRSLDRAL